jgi:predicted nucleic acid-binding protein
MHRPRVYVDTSVFGGTQDEEFSEDSRRFFERVMEGKYRVLISKETLDELDKAPVAVKSILETIPPDLLDLVSAVDEVMDLADRYIAANVLGRASFSDAIHVAAATVANAELILSWNFKHIVNYNRIKGFNGVNVSEGYRSITILSPKEIGYED